MNNLVETLQQHVADALLNSYQLTVSPAEVLVGETKKEFEGDYTLLDIASKIKANAKACNALQTTVS